MPRALVVGTVALFVVLLALAIARTQLWTYGADAGTFAQIVLDTFGGMRDGVEHGTHFRFHWSPTLALLWPVMAATHAVLALQIVQAAATVAAAPLLYALVRPYVAATVATRAGVLALVYPPLIGVGFSEFHEVGLFAPLGIGLVLAADRRAWWWFGACAVAIAFLREDLALELSIAGLAFAFAGTPAGRTRALTIAGIASCALGLASLGLYYGVVVPGLGGWMPAHFYTYPFAAGPLALVIAPLLHPLAFFGAVLTLGRLTYVLEIFAPLALLPFRSRWTWLAAPGLAIVLLANAGLVWRMGTHYPAIWIPWVLIGAAFGARTVERRNGERAAVRWTTAAIALCAVVLIAFNPLHPLHYLKPNYHDLRAARAALACVPPDATVATHDEWYTAIATRVPGATVQLTDGPDYLVYADDDDNAAFARDMLPQLHAAVRSGRYRVACTFGAVHTYRRVTPVSATLRGLHTVMGERQSDDRMVLVRPNFHAVHQRTHQG